MPTGTNLPGTPGYDPRYTADGGWIGAWQSSGGPVAAAGPGGYDYGRDNYRDYYHQVSNAQQDALNAALHPPATAPGVQPQNLVLPPGAPSFQTWQAQNAPTADWGNGLTPGASPASYLAAFPPVRPPGSTAPPTPAGTTTTTSAPQTTVTQTTSAPQFPFYPERDQNPSSTAASSNVPSSMGDFTSWLNNVIGQQFPYGSGQQNSGGGLSGLIPGPTS